MVKAHWSTKLEKLSACNEAVVWARTQPSFAKAWKACERGDWMLWLIGQYARAPESPERKQLVATAVACACLALSTFEERYPNDKRVRNCLDIVEAWTQGKATIEEVRQARNAATYADAATRTAD